MLLWRLWQKSGRQIALERVGEGSFVPGKLTISEVYRKHIAQREEKILKNLSKEY